LNHSISYVSKQLILFMRSIRLELQDDQEVIVDLCDFEDGLVYNYLVGLPYTALHLRYLKRHYVWIMLC